MHKTFAAITAILLLAAPVARGADATGAAMTSAPIVFFDIAGPDAAKLKEFYAGNFGCDIDATLGIKVAASGGDIVSPKIPIPSGVFVLFKDPAGNRMGLVQLKP